MITPINFEIAKLLKEKGFSEESVHYYRFWYGEIQFRLGSMFSNDPSDDCLPNEEFFLAPTIAEVVMWCFNKYKYSIEYSMNIPESGEYDGGYFF